MAVSCFDLVTVAIARLGTTVRALLIDMLVFWQVAGSNEDISDVIYLKAILRFMLEVKVKTA